jgi:site-specific DNA-methyltransferase (adenine-specific)
VLQPTQPGLTVVPPTPVTPTYVLDDPRTEVYAGDCREVLAQLPPGSIDLVFADPPFNIGEPYGPWDDRMPPEQYKAFTADWLGACLRLLKPDGTLVVNVPDDIASEIDMYLKHRGLTRRRWCIWHYRFGQHQQDNFISSKVHVLYFVLDPLRFCWNPDDILVPSDRATRYGDSRTLKKKEGTPGMRVPFDVWGADGEQFWGRIQGNSAERRPGHPNQLPEVYLERVIRPLSRPGEVVLDPFLGSGTTCTVARALGRRSIGVEYNPEFARSAFERIQQGPVRIGAAGVGSASQRSRAV